MHCIRVWIVKAESLRSLKLESIFENKIEFNQIKTTQGENCLATTTANLKTFLEKIEKAIWVETDYFGGTGEQLSELYQFGSLLKGKLPKDINDGLSWLGVTRQTGLDEFDTIGLGKYRTNQNFN